MKHNAGCRFPLDAVFLAVPGGQVGFESRLYFFKNSNNKPQHSFLCFPELNLSGDKAQETY